MKLLAGLLLLIGCAFAHAETPTLTCPADGSAVKVDVGGGIIAECQGSTVTPPQCNGGQVWNGSACACPAGTTWNGLQCVVPPSGINTCSASQNSTAFGPGIILQRQCQGSVSFGHNYHPPYRGPALYRLDVVFADNLHPGPFPNLISGYSMVMPISRGYYVSLAFNATGYGQMQFTADPSYGEAGVISISTQPGVFSGPELVSGPYGPCVYNYGGSNSMWFGMGGADCPLVQGQDYYVNFADVDGDTGLPYGVGQVSYSVVAGH